MKTELTIHIASDDHRTHVEHTCNSATDAQRAINQMYTGKGSIDLRVIVRDGDVSTLLSHLKLMEGSPS